MKNSTLCCALLALVVVAQVYAFEDRIKAAAEQLDKESDRAKASFARRLDDCTQAVFDRFAARSAGRRDQADKEATALVARIRGKGGNYALCATKEEATKTEKVTAATTAIETCTKELTDTVQELRKSSGDTVEAVRAKITFDECKPPSDSTPRQNAESRRCVDRRLSEWIRLLREVERGWVRVLANRATALVQRGQRCLATPAKEAEDALRALVREVTRCDRETARTTSTAAPTTTEAP